ncbi:DUF2155 domain-containing protein [Parvularcula marina]|nr:DUF2155 domain-containing protein [Parvularcula marina]
MIRVLALLTACAALGFPALAAQDDPAPEGTESQEPQGLRSLQDSLDLSLGDEVEMGWTSIPRPLPEEGDAPLTELERLSKSRSGVTFGLDLYNSRADNPLQAVSVTLRALDKITATYKDIEIPIGEEAVFGPLTLLPRTCDKRPPEETPETTVFLEVYAGENDVTLQRARTARNGEADAPAEEETMRSSSIVLPGEDTETAGDDIQGDALFRGWMFASSPSLNAIEHPVYDVWVIDCKMVDPGI